MKSQVSVLIALASAIALLATLGSAQDPRMDPIAYGVPGVAARYPQTSSSASSSRSAATHISNRLYEAQNQLAKAESAAEEETATAAIKLALEEQFAADLEQRKQELEAIKKRIQAMEEQLDKRIAAKDQIIELRQQVIMSEAKGLGWSSQPTRMGVLGVEPPGLSRNGWELRGYFDGARNLSTPASPASDLFGASKPATPTQPASVAK